MVCWLAAWLLGVRGSVVAQCRTVCGPRSVRDAAPFARARVAHTQVVAASAAGAVFEAVCTQAGVLHNERFALKTTFHVPGSGDVPDGGNRCDCAVPTGRGSRQCLCVA